jgi:hypothetical protein
MGTSMRGGFSSGQSQQAYTVGRNRSCNILVGPAYVVLLPHITNHHLPAQVEILEGNRDFLSGLSQVEETDRDRAVIELSGEDELRWSVAYHFALLSQ